MKKILIADDDEAICDSLRLFLEERGYSVHATNELVMEQNIDNDCPDLILLDIRMSGQDGRDICRKIKNNQKTRHIPVIMISASQELISTVKDAGADDFIPKPFELDELVGKINSYLQ